MQTLLMLGMVLAPICQNDTIVRVVRPDSVVITEDAGATQMRIYGKGNDPTYVFNYSRSFPQNADTQISEHQSQFLDFVRPLLGKKKVTDKGYMDKPGAYVTGLTNLHVGASILLDKKGYIPSKAGWNAGVNVINGELILHSRRDAFSLGLGFDATFFRGGKHWQYVKRNGTVSTIAYPDNSSNNRSFLANYALTLPIQYTRAVNRDISLGFLVEPQYTLGNRSRSHYRIDSKRYSDTYYNVDGHRFNVAFGVSFISHNIGGFYIKYKPFNNFSSASPLNFKMLTIGVTL